jgi:hypothetical protein
MSSSSTIRAASPKGEENGTVSITKSPNSGRAGSTNCKSSATKKAATPHHPATGGGPGATAPVAKDRRHRCQVRTGRQKPQRQLRCTLKRYLVHVRNSALSAIVEDHLALLALGDLLSVGREEEAIVAYEQVLKRDPDPEEAENRLEKLRG